MPDRSPSPTSEIHDPRPALAQFEPLVARALDEYGLGATSLENLRYHHNATYRVLATDGATYAFSIRSDHYTLAQLESEMLWLAAMQGELNARVPAPVATLDGRLVCSVTSELAEPRRCTLCRWLPGRGGIEAELTREDFERLGRATAALHDTSFRFIPPDGFTRPAWDEQRFLDSLVADTYARILDHVRRYFSAPRVERFASLTEQGVQRMRALAALPGARGLVHGDLHAGNCLFDGDTVRFVDFEDLSWGYAPYDLATALFGSLDRPDYTERVDAFATAYSKVRPLSSDFARELQLFQVLRAIFLTSLVVLSGDLRESRWWEGYVVGKLERLLDAA